MPKKEIQCNYCNFNNFCYLKHNVFTSVLLTNVLSLWKYWKSEVNKLFCMWAWRKRMTQFCIILSYLLLISNSKVSRAIWKNMHSSVFQRPQIALVLWTRAILIVSCYFEITHLCVFFPNRTRNHAITDTNNIYWTFW